MSTVSPQSEGIPTGQTEHKAKLSKSEKALKAFKLVTNGITAIPNTVSGAVGSTVGGGLGGLIGAIVPGLNAKHMATHGAHEGAKLLSYGVNIVTIAPAAFSVCYSLLAMHLGGAETFKEGLAQANPVREKISNFTKSAQPDAHQGSEAPGTIAEPPNESFTMPTMEDGQNPNLREAASHSQTSSAAPQPAIQESPKPATATTQPLPTTPKDPNKAPPNVIGNSPIAETLKKTELLKKFITEMDQPAKDAHAALGKLKNDWSRAPWNPIKPSTIAYKAAPESDVTVKLPKLNILNRVKPNNKYTIIQQGDKKVEITGKALVECMESAEAGTLDSIALSPNEAERLSKEGFKDGSDHKKAHHRYAVVRNAPPTYLDEAYSIRENINENDRSAFLYVTGIDFQNASPDKVNSLQAKYLQMKSDTEAKVNATDGRLLLNEAEVKNHFKSIFKKSIEEAANSGAKCLVVPGINIGVFANSTPSVKAELTMLFMESLAESLAESPHTENLESVVVSDGQVTSLMQSETPGGTAARETFGKNSMTKSIRDYPEDQRDAVRAAHINMQTEINANLLERFDKAAASLNSNKPSIIITNAETGACEHAALKNGQKPLIIIAADANAVPGFQAQMPRLGNVVQDEAFALRNPVQALAANPTTNPRMKFAK